MWRDLKGTYANHGAAVEFLVSLKRAWFEDNFRVGLETCQEICQVFGHWQNTERVLQLGILQAKVYVLGNDPDAELSCRTWTTGTPSLQSKETSARTESRFGNCRRGTPHVEDHRTCGRSRQWITPSILSPSQLKYAFSELLPLHRQLRFFVRCKRAFKVVLRIISMCREFLNKSQRENGGTVDGRNPAPPEMSKSL